MASLFSLTLFVSAFLLFWVQLMVAKMILPLLGGSPGVWNTCQFFFQAVLLFGYGYSYLISERFRVNNSAIFHCFLLFLPLIILPINIQQPHLIIHNNIHPIALVIILLITSIFIPFFVISTTAPLLQKWLANTVNYQGKNPYFLYSASNAGSLTALFSYPFLIEPNLALSIQSLYWSIGYGVFLLLMLICFGLFWRNQNNISLEVHPKDSPFIIPVKQKLQWLILAFIPASLLLGVTSYLTTDLAAIPLLWAVPLGLYLLTFILAFSEQKFLSSFTGLKFLPVLLTALIFLALIKLLQPLALLLPLHLLGFFLTANILHHKLAETRPPAQYLTEFYLWVALGGVLGGIFNALVAPLLFPTLSEYPLMMLLSLFILPTFAPAQKLSLTAICLGILGGGLLVGFNLNEVFKNIFIWGCGWGLLWLIYQNFALKKLQLVAGGILIFMLAQFSLANLGGVLTTERSFFGVNKVVYDQRGNFHSLLHGSTLHGRQSLDLKKRNLPLTYFHPTGPIGQVFQSLNHEQRLVNVAVLGLGIGTLAAYSQPGQNWTFYEIDSTVAKIAGDARYFTFLQQAKAPYKIILGDARLQISQAANTGYDLLVMDAFSSDSIPVHLITKEAIKIYLQKLTDHGIIAINISNRYLNVEPVLTAISQNLHLAARQQLNKDISAEEKQLGKSASHWVILARQEQDFGSLLKDSRWQRMPTIKEPQLWTDDYSNIVKLLRF